MFLILLYVTTNLVNSEEPKAIELCRIFIVLKEAILINVVKSRLTFRKRFNISKYFHDII